VGQTTKKPNPTFDEPSAKYKKDNAHTKIASTHFWSKREDRSTSKKMTSEPCFGSPVWFELDRAGEQYEVSRKTGWFGFRRFGLRLWRALTMEIESTSTQAAYGRGKARTMANLGASSGRDG
jgi:hypothetical protein